ncbi:MAG: hypothetical protein NTU95_05425 [Methanothrix sp.]|nr:hypothetical protein [Methanothrix sp.]
MILKPNQRSQIMPFCIMSGGNGMQFACPVATGYRSSYAHHLDAPK